MAQNLSLSQACKGLIQYKTATGKSPHTIADYGVTFKKLLAYFDDDPPMASIDRTLLVEFFAWLHDDYVTNPDGVAPRGKKHLSPKSIRNVHTNLSALWSWAKLDGYVEDNPVRKIEKPPSNPPDIQPLTKDEMVLLIKACDETRSWRNRASVSNKRPTADRDRAILLLLLDAGLRASELCGIRFGEVDLATRRIIIRGKGPGRGPKERTVSFGRRTGQALWKSLVPRLDEIAEDDPLFFVGRAEDHRPMTRHTLGKLVKRLGQRAGVNNVYPHKFRHSFAITYLRNGGDVFTLQALLGHSDLAMVKRYAKIALIDTEAAHKRASPVDNWRL